MYRLRKLSFKKDGFSFNNLQIMPLNEETKLSHKCFQVGCDFGYSWVNKGLTLFQVVFGSATVIAERNGNCDPRSNP